MTIAVGCLTHQGILVCADSQFTDGVSKIYKPKIFPYRASGGSLVFAFSGSETNGKNAIDECVENLEKLHTERTLSSIKGALRRGVRKIHQEDVDSRPPEEKEDAAFQLVVAAWLPHGARTGLALFHSAGPNVSEVDGPFICVGIGNYLGNYLMRDAFLSLQEPRLLHDALIIALRGLASVKSFDLNCGGDSQFSVLTNRTITPVAHLDVVDAGKYVSEFDRHAQELLCDLLNPDFEAFPLQFHNHMSTIEALRSKWLRSDEGKGFAVLLKSLLSQAESVDQRGPKDDPQRQRPSLE